MNTAILLKALVEEVNSSLHERESRLTPFLIGEHGTGKTSLITLAVNGRGKPKRIVYIDLECDLEIDIVEVIRDALGWSPDTVIDSK